MMRTPRDTLISWLNDAYGMEQALVPVLENHAKDARDSHPDVQAKDLEHLEQTRRHAELVRSCIERLGGDVSTTKSAMGKVAGFFQGMSTGMAPDELVKNGLSDYAAEQFEIICYKALIHAARIAGHEEIIPTLEEILREDEEMALWLNQNMPRLIDSYLLQPVEA